ncbi:MAG TPA: ABC transporter ATP-binding protein [Patescibacteria group bacterium]|nr:ABC transporter ATP-binding protein [Patescibacteria group bacterium]
MLSIQELKTYFYTRQGAVRAVDGVNIQVDRNQAVGIVGESGCGKTTVAFSIMRLLKRPGRIVGGRILFKDTDLLQLTESEMRGIRGKDIAMVFQDPMTFLNPVLTIGDQIAETILLHQDVEKKEIENKVIEALQLVSIPSPERLIKSYPHQLSGGMCQRVLTSIALACKPSLLIADEPTTALDVTIQAQILELMRQLQRELGLSIVLITHNLGIVADVCDKIAVMYAGKVVEKGDLAMIFDKAAHPYTIGLLETVLTIDKVKEELKTIEGTVPDLIHPPKGCRFSARCRQSREICLRQEPAEVEIEKGHQVSCWLYN